MRGELTTAIYTKLSTLQLADANQSAVLTLIGTDVQRIAETFHYLLVELVPSVVQVGVALYLLYVQLGGVCVAPVLVTVSKYQNIHMVEVLLAYARVQYQLVCRCYLLDTSQIDRKPGLRQCNEGLTILPRF